MAIETLTEEEIEQFLHGNDLPVALRNSAEKVVFILTQDWCSQWKEMQTWIDSFSSQAKIYLLVYNTRKDFQKLMSFKETTFKNFEVPYLRYFHKGELILASNWLPKNTFAAMLNRDTPFAIK